MEKFDTSRREVIKNLAVFPLFGAVFFGMARKRGWISFEEKAWLIRLMGYRALL